MNLEDNNSDDDFEERRSAVRIPGRFEVRFSTPEDAAKALKAYSINISLGGLCLKVHNVHPVGTPITLSLTIGDEVVTLQGVVAWRREAASVIGIRFVDVNPELQERLQILVDSERHKG